MNLTLEQYEALNPKCEIEHEGVKMLFSTPSSFTRWRVESIYTKEPCTLEWIAGFNAGEVLLDCGANVGMYTIWAAATRNVQVYAFEPEAQNYALLNKNIINNDLAGKAFAYCLALSDSTRISQLHMSDLRVGGSNHAAGEALNFKLKPMTPRFSQGCMMLRLDELVSNRFIPVPDHIKIDVDGFEHKVIAGALNTLRNPKVKSLLIETNPQLAEHQQMLHELKALGVLLRPGTSAKSRTQARYIQGGRRICI